MATGTNCGLHWRGWLSRRSGFFGMWHNCFCELQLNEFYVRKNNKSHRLLQRIELNAQTKIEYVDNQKYFAFSIEQNNSSSNNNSYNNNHINFLCEFKSNSNDEEEILQWIVALKAAVFNVGANLSISMFKMISVIGRGNFGKVSLYEKGSETFAIKSIHKSHLISANRIDFIKNEIELMKKHIHFPFIVDLKFSFQTATKFYIGMEFLQGGDLLTLLTFNPKSLSNFNIKLILAQICLALHHLHENHLVYRDLKPENVLFAEDGYVKLIDFGLTKTLDSNHPTTQTFCGTPEFVAPEMVRREKYTYSVDWWAFGVLVYELFFNTTPFFDTNLSHIYGKILISGVTFPDDADSTTRDFIGILLTKNPKDRATFNEIVTHEFFHKIDFAKVLRKEYKPDFVPKIERPTDTHYFDKEFTNERPFDSCASPIFDCAPFVSDFNYDGLSLQSEI